MRLTPTAPATSLGRARAASIIEVILFLVALYFLLAFVLHNALTQRVPGANDFYSRWAGARELFLHGANPYDPEVTRQIQIGMYGRLARPDEDQVAFAYPLYTAFWVWPLVGLPYAQAQALWMSLLVLAVVAGIVLPVLSRFRRLSPIALAALLLGALFFYPSVRGVFLGQFALLAFCCLSLSIVAVRLEWDWLAGVLLALALVKPQPGILLVPVIVLWAAWCRRWKVVFGALGVLALMVVGAMFLLPTWPLDFLEAITHYAVYEPVGPPVQTLSEWLLPGSAGSILTWLVSASLVAWLLWQLFRTIARPWNDFQPTLHGAAIITTLMAGRMGTPDQTLLLIPWLYWMGTWWRKRNRPGVVAAALVLLFLPWVAFLMTLKGNAENVAITLILPLLSFAVYIWQLRGKAGNGR